jgi:PilZ domain
MDRRQHERYDLHAPLSFSWNDAGGIRHRVQGSLRDISGAGVFVSTRDAPPDGAHIQFRLSFDSLCAGSRLIIRARAQVVRVEAAAPIQGCVGFAAAIKTFTLRNNERKLIERGIVGEGPKKGKLLKNKTLIRSRTPSLLWG